MAKPSALDAERDVESGRCHEAEKSMVVVQTHLSLAPRQKLLLLGALAVQNCLLTMLSRRSRTEAATPEDSFASGTVVLVVEVVKVILSSLLLFLNGRSVRDTAREILRAWTSEPWEVAKLVLPSVLYTLQNTVFLMAVELLSAPLMSLLSQIKVLTTAIFSVTLLQRRLTRAQWAALGMLALGVGLVQLSQMHLSPPVDGDGSIAWASGAAEDGGSQQILRGLVLVLIACSLSGFSGVYIEKQLKKSKQSVWLKNLQLATIGIFTSGFVLAGREGTIVRERGFFHGYTPTVYVLILVQAAGGLLVAVIMKYLDNILKTYATSAAILLTCLLSYVFFHFNPNWIFTLGAAFVLVSIRLYNDKELLSKGWAGR